MANTTTKTKTSKKRAAKSAAKKRAAPRKSRSVASGEKKSGVKKAYVMSREELPGVTRRNYRISMPDWLEEAPVGAIFTPKTLQEAEDYQSRSSACSRLTVWSKRGVLERKDRGIYEKVSATIPGQEDAE